MSRPATMLADRYRLVDPVGHGAMGEVWAARDLRLERDVAVKLLARPLASDPEACRRFEAEARSAARLNHPNVISVYDSGEHDGAPFLVMELLPGRTLADELAGGPLDAEQARRIGAQILDALAASHQAGILHRDIKPGNVLLADDGTAKVGDFGIAKSAEGADLTATGMVMGTTAYLAPERLRGQPASARSDLYAVGVVLYEALAGGKPFRADTPLGMLAAIDEHRPVPLAEARPGLDPSLAAAVHTAMAREPGDRFATAADMARALRTPCPPAAGAGQAEPTRAWSTTERSAPSAPPVAAVGGRPSADTAPTALLPPPGTTIAPASLVRPTGRPRGVIVALGVALLLVLVIVIGSRLRSPTDAQDPPAATPGAPATPGTLPPALDEAIARLEQAVEP